MGNGYMLHYCWKKGDFGGWRLEALDECTELYGTFNLPSGTSFYFANKRADQRSSCECRAGGNAIQMNDLKSMLFSQLPNRPL